MIHRKNSAESTIIFLEQIGQFSKFAYEYVNKESFNFSLQSRFTLSIFLVAAGRIYSIIFSRSHKSTHTCHVCYPNGKGFSLLPLSTMLAIGVSFIDAFHEI